MTKANAPLSVRLTPDVTAALERHCAQTGKSRSAVVQQSLAEYLIVHSGTTLGSLAEALLPPSAAGTRPKKRASRQKRFREYVREKRRR